MADEIIIADDGSTSETRRLINTFDDKLPIKHVWHEDIVKARGFDERMKYGGEDCELGERLMNAGIKAVQIRYLAIMLHLDHDRP